MSDEEKGLRQYALEKAAEAFRVDQTIPLVELAKSILSYLRDAQ